MATEHSCPFKIRAHELLDRSPLGHDLKQSDIGGFLMDFQYHLTDFNELKARLENLYRPPRHMRS